MRIHSLIVAVLLLGAAVPSAYAQGQPDYAAARKHYLEAVELEKKGDYENAAREYALAYDITKDPLLFYRIARAYELAGNREAAIIYYRRYVNEAKDAKDREEVRRHIQELEGAGAGGDGEGGGAGARGDGPTGGADAVDDLMGGDDDLGGGGGGDDPAGGGGGAAGGTTTPPTFIDSDARWQRTAAWVSVGAAAVFLTTGALFAASSNSRQEDLEILVDYRDPTTQLPSRFSDVREDYEDKRAEGEKFEQWALFSFAGAGVCAVAAGVFFYLDSTSDRGRVAEKPATQTSIRPVVTPTTVGVSAQWGF